MTCKDNCLHYDVCNALDERGSVKMLVPSQCGCFKDKSKYIELPCKVGTRVFEINSYFDCKTDSFSECHNFAFRGEKACRCCENNVKKNFIRIVDFNLNMIGKIGKSVFVTKEDAEIKLKELNERNQ